MEAMRVSFLSSTPSLVSLASVPDPSLNSITTSIAANRSISRPRRPITALGTEPKGTKSEGPCQCLDITASLITTPLDRHSDDLNPASALTLKIRCGGGVQCSVSIVEGILVDEISPGKLHRNQKRLTVSSPISSTKGDRRSRHHDQSTRRPTSSKIRSPSFRLALPFVVEVNSKLRQKTSTNTSVFRSFASVPLLVHLTATTVEVLIPSGQSLGGIVEVILFWTDFCVWDAPRVLDSRPRPRHTLPRIRDSPDHSSARLDSSRSVRKRDPVITRLRTVEERSEVDARFSIDQLVIPYGPKVALSPYGTEGIPLRWGPTLRLGSTKMSTRRGRRPSRGRGRGTRFADPIYEMRIDPPPPIDNFTSSTPDGSAHGPNICLITPGAVRAAGVTPEVLIYQTMIANGVRTFGGPTGGAPTEAKVIATSNQNSSSSRPIPFCQFLKNSHHLPWRHWRCSNENTHPVSQITEIYDRHGHSFTSPYVPLDSPTFVHPKLDQWFVSTPINSWIASVEKNHPITSTSITATHIHRAWGFLPPENKES
ncbi:hypothetical protein F3Y22_tig00110716pilonHSYRG00245 [Hibiscus syriacus]|uniref:Uncharacterized protein n=1 Tax=Hibiscus syriacus TaxID=106335 RepID=A0A6A2ZWZ8_HIBSY|nr:hypothetical protein F3Y22_tig00110716pilonHSYRG00245 [Hibiscus syriacus]